MFFCSCSDSIYAGWIPRSGLATKYVVVVPDRFDLDDRIYFCLSTIGIGRRCCFLVFQVRDYFLAYTQMPDGKLFFRFRRKPTDSPVLHAIAKLVKYHLGSVAKGSLLITMFKVPRLILTYLYAKWECIQYCFEIAMHNVLFLQNEKRFRQRIRMCFLWPKELHLLFLVFGKIHSLLESQRLYGYRYGLIIY